MKSISEKENSDILLVLASAFANTLDASTTQTLSELAQKSFSTLPPAEFSVLLKRAKVLDELPAEKRERWREICLERILRKTVRLDENINPIHIENVLSREPKSIQNHILRNLPPDLNRNISDYFGIKPPSESENPKSIHQDIAECIRREFLANFVSLEDIYEPLDIDRLTITELTKFIYHLGLREVAVACRGIGSKETLASFLNSFAVDETREIVKYLTELENIKPFWVVQADELVRGNWEQDSHSQQVLAKIGFKLLAIAFAERDETAQRYTQQKLSGQESMDWKRVLQKTEKEFSADKDLQERYRKRRKMIEKFVTKFLQTGRL